jgi:pre-mRNA-splicing helicase BRR2
VAFAVQNEEHLTTSDPVSLVVQLEREFDESAGVLGPVPAPLFPKEQAEGWWLVIGTQEGVLLGIKRVSFGLKTQEKIDFMPPTKVGEHELKILLMSDSFIGCDQEFELVINLAQGDDDDEEDDSDQMDVRD